MRMWDGSLSQSRAHPQFCCIYDVHKILGLSPSYCPAFTSEERDRLIDFTEEGTSLILDHGADPVEVLEGFAPNKELFRDICLSVKYR